MGRKSNSQIEIELIAEVKACYEESNSAEAENRDRWVEDMNFAFVPGAQWDQNALINRQGRPCYSYNRVVGAVNQVIGDQRQARPQAKVRAANKMASVETAEVFAGMIRNIESCSDAESIYDLQYKYSVAGGFGAARVLPKYIDGTFDQELEVVNIPNPLCVFFDPSDQDPFKRNSNYCIIAERISRKAYEAQFPGFTPESFDVSRDTRGWALQKEIRIAEYYKRICKKKKIVMLSDGRVTDYDDEFKAVQEEWEQQRALGENAPSIAVDADGQPMIRESEEWTVKWWKVDGCQILEGPIEYKWKKIPVARLPGRFVVIEGKQILMSLIRFTKDAQRSYNYNRSTMVELTALTPRAPYIGTAKMFKGYENQWNNANKANRPYLTYDVDPDAPNARPTREPPPDVPQALIALATQDAEDIRVTTGYTNPAQDMGEGGQAESGRALIQRARVGDSGAYEFVSNLEKFQQFLAECMIDMIPTTYDTERVVRIIGPDEVEDYVEINKITPDGVMNSLKEGAYDVTVKMGPAFATAREDALNSLIQAVTAMPVIGEVAPDLIAKNLDVDGADELYKRLRMRLIQQGVVQPDEKEAKEIPPPPPPDPVQVAMVDRLNAQSQKDQASAAKTQAETVSAAIDAHMKPAEFQKLVDEIVGKRLENLLAAGQIGIGPKGVVSMTRQVEKEVAT